MAESVTMLASLYRKSGGSLPLHVSIYCKWTIRRYRARKRSLRSAVGQPVKGYMLIFLLNRVTRFKHRCTLPANRLAGNAVAIPIQPGIPALQQVVLSFGAACHLAAGLALVARIA